MPRQTEKITMWFDYPDDPDKGRVEITNLTEEDVAEITAASITTRTIYDNDRGKPVQEIISDTLIDRQETVCRAVKNWENFFDPDGKAMECTDAAKRQWACSNAFMKFVNKNRIIVAEAAEKRAEERRKN
ncbi:MAG: hypothetical protein WBB19_17225 [Desulforhopalus sp.]